VEEILDLPDGRVIHPRLVWRLLKWRDEELRYQLVQCAPSRFVIKLMTTEPAACERLLPGFLDELQELLGPEVSIQPEYHAHLGTTGRARFRPIVPLPRNGGAP
jgi:hypothetical protein